MYDMPPPGLYYDWRVSKKRMMERERVTIFRGERRLAGLWYRPLSTCKGHVLITSHGLLSHKEALKYRLLGERASQEGIFVFSFDYSGCGESSGSLKETTVGERIEDLHRVIDYVKSTEGVFSISLMGSSMGGLISLFLADERRDEIASISTWATPWNLSFFLENEDYFFEELGPPFYRELEEGLFIQAPGKISHLLVIYGTEDEVIPLSSGYQIYGEACEPKSLQVISGGDHSLTREEDLERGIDLTMDWILRFL